MIDRTVPYFPVWMLREDGAPIPARSLPGGYTFDFYRPETGKDDWVTVQLSSRQLETRAQAESLFDSEFMNRAEALSQRMLFVRDAAGTPVASAALWFGSPFGAEIDRIHWVATDEAHQRRGLCGAMLYELLKRHEALGAPGGVYLISQTFSYPAIRIYQRFGFRRLLTRCPAEYHLDAPFAETAARAWAIIDEKLR